jgi:hypothetical protein
MAALCCPLLGDGVTDDTLLHIARFLGPKDLLRLQLANRRFAIKCITAPSGGGESCELVLAAFLCGTELPEGTPCGGRCEALGDRL